MSGIDERFAELRSQNKRALMPFITAGDPDLNTTMRLLAEFESIGCDFCEVGIPYSDPVADGAVIQASYTRALDGGFKIGDLFSRLQETAAQRSGRMQLVAMVSYAIVFRRGLTQFVDDAKQAGFAGCIVPDLPADQAAEMAVACRDRDFALVQLVTPTTPLERAIQIAESSSGFVYFVSVTGITGERQSAPEQSLAKVEQLKAHTTLPICLGFGISQPEHIAAIGPAVDGYIVGSAIVRRVAEMGEGSADHDSLASVVQFAQSMLSAVTEV